MITPFPTADEIIEMSKAHGIKLTRGSFYIDTDKTTCVVGLLSYHHGNYDGMWDKAEKVYGQDFVLGLSTGFENFSKKELNKTSECKLGYKIGYEVAGTLGLCLIPR